MNLMFISDIHGSLTYLEQALKLYEKGGYDRLIILGDVLYHGPRNPLPEGYAPAEVLKKLNAISDQIIAVKGNCDSQVDQMVLDFNIMSNEGHLLLEEDQFFLCHGHELEMATLPKLRQGTIICHGHTHIPVIDHVEGYVIFNPGSIALPKNNTPHTYGAYMNGQLSIYDLTGQRYL